MNAIAVNDNQKFIDCALFILLNWSTIETIFNSVDDALSVLLMFLTNSGAQACFDFISSIFGRNEKVLNCILFITLNWNTISNILNGGANWLQDLLSFLS